MVDELMRIISEDQKNIKASEIAGCIKVASSFPALAAAGILGTGAGILGTHLSNSREKAESERRNKITNILSAAAGAGGAYYLGSGGNSPASAESSDPYSSEISLAEISNLYRR